MTRPTGPDDTVDLADAAGRHLHLPRPPWWLVIAGASLGMVVVGLSFRLSATGAPANAYYVVFWIGMIAATGPAALRAAASDVLRLDRLAALLVFALASGFPKFLRNPFAPAYHDEYAHFRQVTDVLATGELFRPNTLIPIVEFFPGTSALTAGVHLLSGLDVWLAGQALVHLMHALGIVAIFVLGEAVTRSSRAGAMAAVVYGLNPSAVYFDTQYAYESIAINVFMWVLALIALAIRSEDRVRRWRLCALATVFAAAMVVTHHLSTVFMALLLGGLFVVSLVWPRVQRWGHAGEVALRHHDRRVLGGMVVTFGLLVLGWFGLAARPTLTYLSPYFGGSVAQLNDMAAEDGESGRALLAASVQPLWERGLIAAVPFALVVPAFLVIVAVWRFRRTWQSFEVGLIAFAMLYFPSVVFLLAPSGAEGARRSWGFIYVGMAVMLAWLAMRSPVRTWVADRFRPALVAGFFLVLLIGNVAAGLNDPYRFPGPFRWGTDTNSASAQTRNAAVLVRETVGQQRVVTDSYSKLQVGGHGGHLVAMPSPGFPAWDLWQTDEDPTPDLARMLLESGYRFMVVDLRMSEEAPFNGHNFGENDPLLTYATPRENLDRLDHVSWATRVIATDDVRVYRLDLELLDAVVRTGEQVVP